MKQFSSYASLAAIGIKLRELKVFEPIAQKTIKDTLNTHTPSSLYQTFAPAEARRILQKLEIHSTEVAWQLVK